MERDSARRATNGVPLRGLRHDVGGGGDGGDGGGVNNASRSARIRASAGSHGRRGTLEG